MRRCCANGHRKVSTSCTKTAPHTPKRLRRRRAIRQQGIRTMTGTPLAFADAPPRHAESRTIDVLTDVLRAVRLTGAVFLSSRLTAPFGITAPKRYDPLMPMARLRHV